MDGEFRLARVRFRRRQAAEGEWTSSLLAPEVAEKLPYEPERAEVLPRWQNPQRAFVCLLLRSFGAPVGRYVLRGPADPLARPLFDSVRRAKTANGRATWIQGVFGLGDVEFPATRRKSLSAWIYAEGSASGKCALELGASGKKMSLEVYLDGEHQPEERYNELADALSGRLQISNNSAEPELSIDLMLWNDARASYAELRGPVSKGDELQIRAHSSAPVFMYAIWLDQEGALFPLFPWKELRWRSAQESSPRTSILLPAGGDGEDSKYEVGGSRGLEAIVLAATRSAIEPSRAARVFRSLAVRKSSGQRLAIQRPTIRRWNANGRAKLPVATIRTPTLTKPSAVATQMFGEIRRQLSGDFEQGVVCIFPNRGGTRTK